MSEKFKVGDKVRVVNDHDEWLYQVDYNKDTIWDVVETNNTNGTSATCPKTMTIPKSSVNRFPNDFEKVYTIESESNPMPAREFIIPMERSKELGVYRPALEDRKVGKVRVELVDKGFPNALWEIAKLMTWAQEAKGYKDHDWKNLPDAKNSLPAAASRHRQQHNKGELYDEESKLHHKVSEAFGVLAELELMLTGVIK